MSWLEARFQIGQQDLAHVEQQLEALSALSVTLADAGDQPFLETPPGEIPIWDEVTVVALFEESADMTRIRAALSGTAELRQWQVTKLADRDWERTWMDQFEPIRFGKRLWICPTWHQPPDPTAVNLTLDPGLAFGSGTHPTTALCLEWLDAHPPQGKTVIDYGCGSGVLALATLLLGATHATGIDIDPKALIASRENAEKNRIPASALSLFLTEEAPARPADLLLANILSGPLIELAPRLASLTKAGGEIILSGILDTQTESIINAYHPWFEITLSGNRDGWACLTGKKRDE